MLTSIATVSMSGTLEDKLQAVAAAGFDMMMGLRWLQVLRGPGYLVLAVGVWVAM